MSTKPLLASGMAQELVRRFGKAGDNIQVTMRPYTDVSDFIKNMERAHKRAATSTSRFCGLIWGEKR